MHGVQRWYLNVDVDEYLVYDDYEHRTLQELIVSLGRQGVLRCPAPMIDCYPDGPIHEAVFEGDTEEVPWATAPLLDQSGYSLQKTNRALSLKGGVRPRAFDSDLELMKYPLLFWRDDDGLGASIHQPSPYNLNFSPIYAVLLHFKFFNDIGHRARLAVKDDQYFDGAREYRKIAAAIESEQNMILNSSESIRFSGSKDLIERGFMKAVFDARNA